MASQKHLDLLSSGKTLWNEWRQVYADVHALEPDFHEADLKGATISKAIFDEAFLTKTEPRGAHPDTFDQHEFESTEVKV